MRILLLGPPGAGKGTQATVITQAKKVPHISTGEIMRQAVGLGTPVGQKVKGYLDRGELVPDQVVLELIRERLGKQDCEAGFLLDGFPRTVPQVKQLDELLSSMGKELTHAINMEVPQEVLLERIRGRAAQGSGRSDDNIEVAMKRFKVFVEQTAPAIELYRGRAIFHEINGLGTVDDVSARILKILSA